MTKSRGVGRGNNNRNVTDPLFVHELRGYITPCWTWKRSMNNNGYGMYRRVGYHSCLAHRVVFQIYGNELRPDQYLDHLCRNRDCVRPDHLEIVTQAENCRRGKRTKFIAAQIADVRALRAASVPYKVIMEKHGISEPQIWAVTRGKQWQ